MHRSIESTRVQYKNCLKRNGLAEDWCIDAILYAPISMPSFQSDMAIFRELLVDTLQRECASALTRERTSIFCKSLSQQLRDGRSFTFYVHTSKIQEHARNMLMKKRLELLACELKHIYLRSMLSLRTCVARINDRNGSSDDILKNFQLKILTCVRRELNRHFLKKKKKQNRILLAVRTLQCRTRMKQRLRDARELKHFHQLTFQTFRSPNLFPTPPLDLLSVNCEEKYPLSGRFNAQYITAAPTPYIAEHTEANLKKTVLMRMEKHKQKQAKQAEKQHWRKKPPKRYRLPW